VLVESVPKVGLPADRGSNAADILLRVSSDMAPANWRLASVSEEALSFLGQFWVTPLEMIQNNIIQNVKKTTTKQYKMQYFKKEKYDTFRKNSLS